MNKNVRNLFYSVYSHNCQAAFTEKQVSIYVCLDLKNIFTILKNRKFNETESCPLSELWCLKMVNQFLTKKNTNKARNTPVRS